MPKWIGFISVTGEEAWVFEAEDEATAREQLYQRWLEACENEFDRQLYPYTAERAEELEATED